VAGKEQLPLTITQEHVLHYKMEGLYDLVICMGNSLNFFDAADTVKLMTTITAHLKPGGHFLINSWSIAEISFKNFKEKSWSRVGDLKFLSDSKLLFHPTRIESESIIIAPDGETETKTGIDYIFSLNEMEAMLNKAGLRLQEVYSIPGRKKFSLGDPRAYLVAEKI
jgi:SAM-dependent methyltransferase